MTQTLPESEREIVRRFVSEFLEMTDPAHLEWRDERYVIIIGPISLSPYSTLAARVALMQFAMLKGLRPDEIVSRKEMEQKT